jgi:ubiquinone biosynthesis protein
MIARALRIVWAAVGFVSALLVARARRSNDGAAARLRRTLESLGPTFVKLGQALSQRRDLLSRAWTDELARLQDHVAPFPGDAAADEITLALGRRPEALFAEFDAEPMAAASIAQVHRAALTDGRAVVVKVLRPGVRAQIDRDMRILLLLARIATAFVPYLRSRRAAELTQELWRNLRLETDLLQEARNIRRFARAFAGSSSVFIPGVVDEFSATTVLVQEYSHGLDIGDPALAPQAGRLSDAFIDFYLQQFFRLGVFHADPHPGNIFVLADGRLCFHDFGAIGFLDTAARRALEGFVLAFAHQDARWITDTAIDLGLLNPAADRAAIVRGVEAILSDLQGLPLQDWSMAALMLQVVRLGGGDGAALPPHLAVLVRTVFTAEGALRTLDPALDVVGAMRSGGERLLAGGFGAGEPGRFDRLKWEAALAVRAAPGMAAAALHGLGNGRGLALHVPEAAQVAGRLGRAADRIAVALVTLGLYIAASLLMQHSIGPRILGDLPLLAAIGYALALWFTLRLVIGIGRIDGPGGL